MNNGTMPPASPNPRALRVRGLWALMHPGPSLITAGAYGALALLAARGRPAPVTLAVTLVGMIALQFAISAFNDYCDRKADVLSHKFKPLALGILSPRVALIATALLTALMIACYLPYGLTPLLIAGGFLVLGFAYDLGLKSTPFGALLMGLAFSLLPILAWTLFASATPAIIWIIPIGLAVGASIHIADALPDLASDRAAGAYTLAQALGAAALAVEWALLAGAGLLTLTLAALGWTPSRPLVLFVSTPLTFVFVAASILAARAPWTATRRQRANFILTVAAALVIAVGWVASALM